MARNGSGTYVLPAGQPVVVGTTILDSVFNTLTTDIANALTTSVCTDGQTPMTGNLPMGSHKLTGLSNGSALTDSVNYGQTINLATSVLPNRNIVVNAKMEVAQRASSFALSNTTSLGSLDRWFGQMTGTAAGTLSQAAAPAGSGFNNVAKLQRNNGSSSTGVLAICQAFESVRSIPLAGKTIAFSFYAYSGANFSTGGAIEVAFYSGTGTDQTTPNMLSGAWTGQVSLMDQGQAISSSFTRYTFIINTPSNATQLGCMFKMFPAGTAGADDSLYITGVQVEPLLTNVTNASAFEYLSPVQDLMECKRFYQTVNLTVIGYNNIGQNISSCVSLPVQMRAVPTAAQVTNNASLSSINITGTTSTYLPSTSALTGYRPLTATGPAQWSEIASLSAEI